MNENKLNDGTLPLIIQGGMGIGVSCWQLARAVSLKGQLGVISGTALNTVLVRRLQDGDREGHVRRALTQCPLRGPCARILRSYWIDGGKPEEQPYKLAPLFSLGSSRELIELTIVANFVEVHLAKEGHGGWIGINLLEKIQLPTLASLFGAMLAGVDYVLMGAGIPRAIPGVLDALAEGRAVKLSVYVEGDEAGTVRETTLDPASFFHGACVTLRRPKFVAIVSSSTLATTLARKASGRVDGFVVEGFVAGGHNAPPRGAVQINGRGEPVYGQRDVPDLAAIRSLNTPFWLAGAYAHPEKVREAVAAGAAGVQVGSAFAFCEESGLSPEIKRAVLASSVAGEVDLFTDVRASPTGMPFKVVGVDGTVSDPGIYRRRARVCDLGYLRQPYAKSDGSTGYRCPAEPEQDYVRKGGALADTVGRKCLCNGLLSAIGIGQPLAGVQGEPAIVTAGEDAVEARRFLRPGRTSYSAADVLTFLGAPAVDIEAMPV
jgi:NAD(P)H-dependent flavin oxidoreductase YrpB (nitropropane dioxygenase family)